MLLKEVEGHSVEELAQMTGMNENTIKVKLFRTRQKLVKAAQRLGKGGTNRFARLSSRIAIVAGKPDVDDQIRAGVGRGTWEEAMHQPVIDRLEEYLDGNGPFPEVEEHLSKCASCRQDLAAMQAQTALFRRAFRAEVEPDGAFYARVMNRIESQANRRSGACSPNRCLRSGWRMRRPRSCCWSVWYSCPPVSPTSRSRLLIRT